MPEERQKKNEVFQQPQSAISAPTQHSAIDILDMRIPSQIVPLPSRGKTYGAGHPLCNVETTEIASMTTREEDILTSVALLKRGAVVTEMIKSCIMNKAVNPIELLSGDRNALLVAIRVSGYGQAFEGEIECSNPECELKTSRTFDLGSLPIKWLDIDPVSEGTNLFEFKLPVTGHVVKFRFLTGRDEEESIITKERQKKAGLQTQDSVTSTLLQEIVSVAGEEDRTKLSKFVRIMPAGDSLALRSYIRQHEPGIIMKQETECPNCHHVEEVTLPLGISFLWPNLGSK